MIRAFALALLLAPLHALAGAQRQEPIDPAVLATLTAQVADRAAPYFNFKSPVDGHRWVHEMSERLRKRIPDRKERIEIHKTNCRADATYSDAVFACWSIVDCKRFAECVARSESGSGSRLRSDGGVTGSGER